MSKYTFDKPVILIGAGRSGTTILKDTLGAHPDFHSTEFELNYLWRTGNANLPHDMLDPIQHGRKKYFEKIRKELFNELQKSGKKRLVEKTVANVMRPHYVHAVLPEAKIIHIIRDGRAVTASAMKRWRAKPKGSYFLTKMRTVPLYTLPLYGGRYIKSKIIGLFRKTGHNQTWGPRWVNMDEETKNKALAEICAEQWKISVETAHQHETDLPKECYLEIKYEDLVHNTGQTLDIIAKFLDVENPAPMWTYAKNTLRDMGNDWRHDLSSDEQSIIEKKLLPLLQELKYA